MNLVIIWIISYNLKNTVYSEMKALIVGGSSGMGKETYEQRRINE